MIRIVAEAVGLFIAMTVELFGMAVGLLVWAFRRLDEVLRGED